MIYLLIDHHFKNVVENDCILTPLHKKTLMLFEMKQFKLTEIHVLVENKNSRFINTRGYHSYYDQFYIPGKVY